MRTIPILVFSTLASHSVIVSAQHDSEPDSWKKVHRRPIDGDALLPMRIGLRPKVEAARNAEAWLMDVSDPDSPNYGQHWTQEQVTAAFQPSEETVNAVKSWLSEHGVQIDHVTHTDNGMWLAFDMPASHAEEMLQTKYFEHWNVKGRFEASSDDYALPADLLEHVDVIKPGLISSDVTGRTKRSREFLNLVRRRADQKTSASEKDSSDNATGNHTSAPERIPPNDLSHCHAVVTPACIRAMYNLSLPDINTPVSDKNHLGIFQDFNTAYQADLNRFFDYYTDIPNGTAPIFKSIDGALVHPNETLFPSYRGWFWPTAVHGEATLDLELAMPMIYPQNVTIFQNDDPRYALYANKYEAKWYLNDFLDAIDGSYCKYDGLERTFPHHYPVYPDPAPPYRHNGTGYNGTRQCGVFQPTPVISVSYALGELGIARSGGDTEAYMRRQCTEYLKLGLQGVSIFFAAADTGVGPCVNNTISHGRVFSVFDPSDCPWVTSVGATKLPRNASVDSLESSVIWTTGGFSLLFDRPAYQHDAVYTYLNNYVPDNIPYFRGSDWSSSTGRYNRDGRGFPDLAAVGESVAVSLFLRFGRSGGTSASTPIIAALFNRVVEERLRAGKGALGFVNPALYKNAGILNDVLTGRNNYICRHGFSCAPGWDPVSGLGTPDYGRLLDFFMSLP